MRNDMASALVAAIKKALPSDQDVEVLSKIQEEMSAFIEMEATLSGCKASPPVELINKIPEEVWHDGLGTTAELPKQGMKRNDFLKLLDIEDTAIRNLFGFKNKAYGGDDDLFYNFRETARRHLPDIYKVDPHAAMFKVAEIFLDKHNVALTKGITVGECRERLRDRVIYSLIQMAMIDERGGKEL